MACGKSTVGKPPTVAASAGRPNRNRRRFGTPGLFPPRSASRPRPWLIQTANSGLPVYQSSFRTAASAPGENRRALRRADHRAVEGCDLRDQSREIMSEHSLAIPAAPRAFFDLDVVPVDAPAGARHLQSLSALSLHYFHVLGSQRKIHLGPSGMPPVEVRILQRLDYFSPTLLAATPGPSCGT